MIRAITREFLLVSERLPDKPRAAISRFPLSPLFFSSTFFILSYRHAPPTGNDQRLTVIFRCTLLFETFVLGGSLSPDRNVTSTPLQASKSKAYSASLWALLMNMTALRGLASVAPSQLIATAPSQLIAIYPLLQALSSEAPVVHALPDSALSATEGLLFSPRFPASSYHLPNGLLRVSQGRAAHAA